MNDLAREKLVQAALDGVPQCKGKFYDGDARCALGVLGYGPWMKGRLNKQYDLDFASFPSTSLHQCPHECGFTARTSADIIIHMNDDHGDSFLDIARKMP